MATGATAARLLDATWDVIRANGIAGATSRAITDAAGANLGAITYHYGSKDRLVAAALTRQLSTWFVPALEALTEPGVDPLQRVAAAVGRLTQTLESRPDDHRAIVDALAAARHLELVDEAMSDLFSQLRSAIAAHLADPAFGIPEWVDPEAHAGLLVAVGIGIATVTALDRRSPSAGAMAGQMLSTLLAARGAVHGSPPPGTGEG